MVIWYIWYILVNIGIYWYILVYMVHTVYTGVFWYTYTVKEIANGTLFKYEPGC